MNSETLQMVDPDVLKAVKTVVDENVPTGMVAVQMTDGSVQHMPVDAWQTQVKAELAKQQQVEHQAAVEKAKRKASHKIQRQNRLRGRRQQRG